MRAEDLISWLTAVPFAPFRIRMVSGQTHDIRHPEMLRVGRTTMYVFTYTAGVDEPVERMQMVSLGLIENIEALQTVPAV